MRRGAPALLILLATFVRASADDPAGRRPVDPFTVSLAELAQDDPARRLGAFEVLDKLGMEAARAVPALVAALSDDDARVRTASLRLLDRLGAEALGPLVDFLGATNDAHAAQMLKAAEVVRQIGQRVTVHDLAPGIRSDLRAGSALAALCYACREEDGSPPAVLVAALSAQATVANLEDRPLALASLAHLGRVAAAHAVGTNGELTRTPEGVRTRLASLMADPGARRMLAAALLADVSSSADGHALSSLVEAERSIALPALGALVRLGRKDVLRDLLDPSHPQEHVRVRAAGALAAFPEVSTEVVPVLRAALEPGPTGLRMPETAEAASALGRLGPGAAAALPRLRELAGGREPPSVAAAVAALAIGGEDETVRERVRAALASLRERDSALEALRVVAPRTSFASELTAILTDAASGRASLKAAWVLRRSGAELPVGTLAAALTDSVAARSLGEGRTVLEAVAREGWRYERSFALPPVILAAIAARGSRAAEAVPAVESVAASGDPVLRILAALTLRAIRPPR